MTKRKLKYCCMCKARLLPRQQRYCSQECRAGTGSARKFLGSCVVCGKGLILEKSQACPGSCTQTLLHNSYIERWKQGLEDGLRAPGVISMRVRRYLIEVRGERCEECGWDKRHPVTGRVPLQIHHIDGDANKSTEVNLKVLCPNCHSLTPTFGNLNAGQGRASRRKQVDVKI